MGQLRGGTNSETSMLGILYLVLLYKLYNPLCDGSHIGGQLTAL